MSRGIVLSLVSFALGIAIAAGFPFLRARLGGTAETPAAAQPTAASTADPGIVRFPDSAPQLSQIRVTPVRVSAIPLIEPLAARLAYDESRTTRVNSPVAGRIVSLFARPGDMVRAGDALARIDSPDFGAAVSDAEKATADAERKDAALKRSRALLAEGLLAQRDLESAEADARQADSELRRARARLANLNGLRAAPDGRFELVSPVAGVVADRQANPGMEVRPDVPPPNPLFTVSDLRTLWAILDVPEPSLHSISKGSEVTLEVAAYPGREFRGRIDFISPVLDPATRRVQARMTVDNTDGALRPEMYAKAIVSSADGRKALRVPIGAFVSIGERSYVFVEGSAGTFERRAVEMAAQNRDFAYVTRGLEVGDRVVTTGALLLASEAGIGR